MTAALCHEDIISDLSPVFDSIPELCTSSGPVILTKVVLIAKPMSWIHPTQTLAFVGPVVILVFHVGHVRADGRWGHHPSYGLCLVEG